MKRAVRCLVVAMLLAGFDTAGSAESDMEVVLVTGKRPGPALWKVSSGDHVLWIMGDVTPIPQGVKWRSKKFEKLLKESQEVLIDDTDDLLEPANEMEWAAVLEVQTPPSGQTLQDFVSPGMYARARAVQEKFHAGNIEMMRPWAAMSRIYDSAFKSMGLVEFSAVASATKLARKAKVRTTTITFRPSFAELMDYLEHAPGDECLLPVVETLGDGGSGIRRLGNAWALGDIDPLRELVPAYAFVSESWGPGKLNVCQRGGPQRAAEYFEQRAATWLLESARALRDNRSTMAVMPIGWLMDPDGYVAQMRARGFEVVEPE